MVIVMGGTDNVQNGVDIKGGTKWFYDGMTYMDFWCWLISHGVSKCETGKCLLHCLKENQSKGRVGIVWKL